MHSVNQKPLSPVPTVSELLQLANIDTCSYSESDNSAAVIGGVVVALVVISALTVTVIVVLVLRSRIRSYSTNDRHVAKTVTITIFSVCFS